MIINATATIAKEPDGWPGWPPYMYYNMSPFTEIGRFNFTMACIYAEMDKRNDN